MSQNKKQLQIKQLSPNGQLLNCVNCYSGQVSVLRTTVQSAIQPYMNALAGISGPERFNIEFDHEPYVPHLQNLIGFGERFVAADGTTEEYLLKNRIPSNLIQSLLVSFGLENVKLTPCVKLNRCEERRIRILAAVYDASKMLVIYDPFDPISSEWRERFAELLVNFARTKSQIVIIPFLSYRPECWIDNEFIARIQVGEAIQKTIGFTSQANNMQAMINQIREEHKRESNENIKIPSQKISIPNEATTPPSQQPKVDVRSLLEEHEWEEPAKSDELAEEVFYEESLYQKHKSKIAATGIAFLVLFLVFSFKEPKKPENFAAAKPGISNPAGDINVPLPPAVNADIPVVPADPPTSTEAISPGDIALNPVKPQEIKEMNLALVMRYPENIKDSIIKATNPNFNTGLIKRHIGQTSPADNQPTKQNKEASDFLKLLATAGTDPDGENGGGSYSGDQGGYNESPAIPAPIEDYAQSDPSEEQARREQIRQKFLEAIQRAQEKSQ